MGKIDKKTFCINCFQDYNIKDFIKKNGNPIKDENYKCVFCQTNDPWHEAKYEILDYGMKEKRGLIDKDLYIISQRVLNQEIIKIINEHYEFIDNPKYSEKGLVKLSSILDKLFQDKSDVLTRLSQYDFIRYKKYPFNESEYRTYIKDSKEHYTAQDNHWLNWWKPKSFDWNKFKEHTKHKSRFFDHKESSFQVRKELSSLIPTFKLLEVSRNSENIFRARESSDEFKKKLNNSSIEVQGKELGKAPIKIVKNNRFSPIGISYGYFSFDRETALSEIRAEIGQNVAIGCFILENDLKLVDFREEHFKSTRPKKYMNPFDKENFNILLFDILSLSSFLSDISKPILPNDTLLEYVPTQIMSEYILSLGYDGFIFDSSQKKDGENIVIFGKNPEYQDYEVVEITNQNIEFKIVQ